LYIPLENLRYATGLIILTIAILYHCPLYNISREFETLAVEIKYIITLYAVIRDNQELKVVSRFTLH